MSCSDNILNQFSSSKQVSFGTALGYIPINCSSFEFSIVCKGFLGASLFSDIFSFSLDHKISLLHNVSPCSYNVDSEVC